MSLSQGRSIKEIARSCDISSRSVETYINRIKNKKLYAGDNDEDDLIGYLLLKKAKKRG